LTSRRTPFSGDRVEVEVFWCSRAAVPAGLRGVGGVAPRARLLLGARGHLLLVARLPGVLELLLAARAEVEAAGRAEHELALRPRDAQLVRALLDRELLDRLLHQVALDGGVGRDDARLGRLEQFVDVGVARARLLALDRLVEVAQRVLAHLVELGRREAVHERGRSSACTRRRALLPLLRLADDGQVLAVEDVETRFPRPPPPA
jgi:hypothetical protein